MSAPAKIDPRYAHLVGRYDAIVIGTSAGGVLALKEILPKLTAQLAIPVLVVLHLPADKKSLLPEMFAAQCAVPVHEVEDHDALSPGIWFAPPGYHVVVDSPTVLTLSLEEPVNWSRPSIDVLFESAALVFGRRLLAVLLTGASSDGAVGVEAVRANGGSVVVQTPASATSAAMPTAALGRVVPDHLLDLSEIGGLVAVAGLSVSGAQS